VKVSLALSVTIVAIACAPQMHLRHTAPSAARDWPTTIGMAQRAVAGGRYMDAERALATFAQEHPGAEEARETLYWRALFHLDPANHNRSTDDAVKELDAYLLDGGTAPHREEAQVLRRIALSLDSLGRSGTLIVSLPTDTVVEPSQATVAREQELQKENQKLKDQLEKTKAELERIKKRLAAPKPDGELERQ